ncbi:pseudouridine synthase family protein [Campylobacter sp. MIT 97-5078]|uniref:pseudouridine synthase family protein n=1 Tax=Campylobacter sp. MIT 97-5078 TaxID=1548153 RepID=UPI000513EFC3|nr:RluA family pseudouridine synthase [Campylobacter sp. MIT 97-5078]KGI57386.1 pseudouridine synthase [Campylobacter sp. MIT 97-5078]TQR28291.1 RluA family pseudouridine synthase [Campylobacter sp. MIT 97-5078]
MQEKAYKLLAIQEKISNNYAKELIDSGLVFVGNKKLSIARELLPLKSKFKIMHVAKAKIIFEDDKIIALNKPFALVSENLEKEYKAKLLNRLDKETSGVILLCKDEDFRQKAIQEYKKQRVKKEYIAILEGILAQELEVNEPILTLKNKQGALSKISKDGLSAISIFTPLMVSAKKTLARVQILTGRTHQIRLHATFIKHGVVGDEKYAHSKAARMYLHSYKIGIFDYEFKADLDKSFQAFDFDLKNFAF